MTLLDDLRADYHEALCAAVLGLRPDGSLNNADSGNVASKALAERLAALIAKPLCLAPPTSGQTAGNEFTRITMNFLKEAFPHMQHVRPGDWFYAMNPSESQIARFDQYAHLDELKAFLVAHKGLATALGRDYLVTPDIIVGRHPVEESDLNSVETLASPLDVASRRSPLRKDNRSLPILHASISCKWTMRSDRAQNTRTEALNLIRNRKGRSPHIAAVTFEPLPSRIASIAMGTGDIDCTYHGALDELLQATKDLGFSEAQELLETLIDGRRLRDISDLPFDLAT